MTKKNDYLHLNWHMKKGPYGFLVCGSGNEHALSLFELQTCVFCLKLPQDLKVSITCLPTAKALPFCLLLAHLL